MSQTVTMSPVTAASTPATRRVLLVIVGAVISLALAALFLIAIGAAIAATQHVGAAVVAIVMATYAGGGALVGSIIANLPSSPDV